jgi:hypothetical protein
MISSAAARTRSPGRRSAATGSAPRPCACTPGPAAAAATFPRTTGTPRTGRRPPTARRELRRQPVELQRGRQPFPPALVALADAQPRLLRPRVVRVHEDEALERGAASSQRRASSSATPWANSASASSAVQGRPARSTGGNQQPSGSISVQRTESHIIPRVSSWGAVSTRPGGACFRQRRQSGPVAGALPCRQGSNPPPNRIWSIRWRARSAMGLPRARTCSRART